MKWHGRSNVSEADSQHVNGPTSTDVSISQGLSSTSSKGSDDTASLRTEPYPAKNLGSGTFMNRLFKVDSPWQDWLFIPLLAIWVGINVGLYSAYPAFILRVGTFSSGASVISPYTWSSSLLLFIYSIWLFQTRYHLDYVRSVLFALSLSFAATSLFEITYQNIGAGFGVGNHQIEGQLINLSAIGLAFSSLRFWRASRVLLYSVILYLTGWILWVSAGYPQIFDSNPSIAHQAYVFNAALKVGAFVLFGLLVSFAGRSNVDWGVSSSNENTPSGKDSVGSGARVSPRK